MLDFGIDKLALIGGVALIVIGPERLPRVARTVGVLLGKAQRYMSQVQSEVKHSMELEELQKMKAGLDDAARDIGQSIHTTTQEASAALSGVDADPEGHASFYQDLYPHQVSTPKRKNWRLKRGATPLWYKQHAGIRRHAQSGAARVARFRPPAPGTHR